MHCRSRIAGNTVRLLPILMMCWLLVASLTGCRREPVTDGGSGEPSHVLAGVSYRLARYAHYVPIQPGTLRVIGTARLEIRVDLAGETSDSEWWSTHLKVVGVEESSFSCVYTPGSAIITLAKGEPRERVTIEVEPLTIPDDAGNRLEITFVRSAEPSAVIEFWEDGGWRSVTPREFLPGKQLRLRLLFATDVDRADVEARLQALGAGEVQWQRDENEFDGVVAVFSVPSPPPALDFGPLGHVKDAHGAALTPSLPLVFAGRPPVLYRYDPVLRGRGPVCELMVDLYEATISPDGRHVLLRSWDTTGADYRTLFWIVDTATGEKTALDQTIWWAWAGNDQVVLADYDERTKVYRYKVVSTVGALVKQGELPAWPHRLALSHDGRTMAQLVPEVNGSSVSEDYLASYDLFVVDLPSGTVRTFQDVVRLYSPPVGNLVRSALAWSPDDSCLAIVSDGRANSTIMVINVATGTSQPAATLPYTEASHRPFSWSPSGKLWLSGNLLIETEPPYVSSPVPVEAAAVARWSPDGSRVGFSESGLPWDWANTWVVTVGSAEPGHNLGLSLPAGWSEDGLFYFVQWDAAAEYAWLPDLP